MTKNNLLIICCLPLLIFFVIVDEMLQQAGVCAPKVYATDYTNGFILLEDFGDDTFTKLIQEGKSEASLYQQATDTLIKLQKNAPSDLTRATNSNSQAIVFI